MAFPTQIDTVKRQRLGLVKKDYAGNEYVYLQGVASTVVGSVVTYGLTGTNAFQTALSVTGAKGPVAIAMAAVLAANYGWFQRKGTGTANFNGSAVAGAKLYSASTGLCDDAVVSGDQITGAIVGATVSTSGLGSVFLDNPFMNNLG